MEEKIEAYIEKLRGRHCKILSWDYVHEGLINVTYRDYGHDKTSLIEVEQLEDL